jgi:DsbC/DsbD-like thiol-disulfide interchange protein
MVAVLSSVISLFIFRFRSRAALELKLVALQHQLAVLRRQRNGRPQLSSLDRRRWVLLYTESQAAEGTAMTITESKQLKKGTRVYWRGDTADSGIVTEISWDAVTIAWENGKTATVHHGDMREIYRAPTKSHIQ